MMTSKLKIQWPRLGQRPNIKNQPNIRENNNDDVMEIKAW